MTPTPMTRQQLAALMAAICTADLQAAGVAVPDTGPLSFLGAIFDGASTAIFGIETQNEYVSDINDPTVATGADLVAITSPYGVAPVGGSAASGTVILTLQSAAAVAVLVPFGFIFTNPTTGIQYVLTADQGQAAITPTGYLIPAGQVSINATVTCTQTGTVGNTGPNSITVITSGLGATGSPPIASVTNPQAFTNALPQESDASLLARFQAHLAGGGVGTPPALYKAAVGAQPGLVVSIGDCLDQDGNLLLGWSSVFVTNAGSTAGPSPALEALVTAAVEAVRSGGMQFKVYAPTPVPINFTALIRLDGTQPWSVVQAAAAAALATFANNVGMEPIQKPGSITTLNVPISGAYNALLGRDASGNLLVPGILQVDDLLLNGSYASIAVPYGSVAVAGTIALTQE